MMSRQVVTMFIYPPIPVRSFDYAATYDGYEPGDAIGYGTTRDEAIRDLLNQFDEVHA